MTEHETENVDTAQDADIAAQSDAVETVETMPQDVFVEATAIEEEHGFLFAGDKGQLSLDARRVFAMLLQRRFIEAVEDKWAWEHILKNQNDLESRFHDMFLDLVVDRNYGVAYKTQLRHEELNIPILLRDDSYKRAETVVLVYLRSAFRQQVSQGAGAAFVDQEELAQHAMSFFASDETNLALRQREVVAGIDQLAREGILKEASEGRYRISPIIEVLMPIERIKQLTTWIEERIAMGGESVVDDEDDFDVPAADANVSDAAYSETDIQESGFSEALEDSKKINTGDSPELSMDLLAGVDQQEGEL